MNTPAVTMVAAWISAETGVGPSIASGNQVCSRNWADLPIAPMKRSMQASVKASACQPKKSMVLPTRPGAPPKMVSKSVEPISANNAKMPSAKPKSPTRLTTNALIAAAFADGFLVPEPDQQVARETDPFPAEEQLDEIVGRHQHQHRKGEQGQITEEPRPVRILVHVADRIEVHERGHCRHHHQHHGGERVDPQAPRYLQVAGRDPREQRDPRVLVHEPNVDKGDPGKHRRNDQQTGGDQFRRA